MGLNISKVGIDLIKSFEGCSLKAYLCPANVWTIGWGTTGDIDGVKIGPGMTITQNKADSIFINKLKAFEDAVNKYVTYKLNQNQYDALVSFAYNCGAGALQKSDLLKHLNQGNVTAAANQFDLWTRGGGVVLAGLVRRRAAEKKLFLTPWEGAKEVKKKIKIKLNGVIKEVEAIEDGGNNFVKLQDLRDWKIDISYDSIAKIPVVEVR